MREGKMRSNSQVIGDKAVAILKSFFQQNGYVVNSIRTTELTWL